MLALSDVFWARRALQPHIWRTPVLPSAQLGSVCAAPAHLKLECWQRTGSFKVRGALSALSMLPAEARARGVVTASAGNHGLGLAYAAQIFGPARVVVFVPQNAPEVKVRHLSVSGCEVHRGGSGYDAAHTLAVAYAREHSAVYVSAYDDPWIVAGQATVGLEILEDLPDTDLLLVPVGGGSLVAGIALAAKALRPGVRIIGVQPEASPAAFLSLRDGRAYETYPAASTVCDGLTGGFGRLPFELAGPLIDDVLIVPEDAVRHAVVWLLRREQLLVEPSGAISIAPLLTGQLRPAGQRVVAVLTGRNIEASLVGELLGEYADL